MKPAGHLTGNMKKGVIMSIRKLVLLGIMLLSLLAGCGEQSPQVTVTNDLGIWDITEVFVDPSDSPWSESRLGSDNLEPGESVTVDITPGTWDIQVIDEDGDSYTIWTEEIGQSGFTWNVTLDDMD